MRFDSFIRFLLPREERFHELFSENTRNLVKGGELFLAIAIETDPAQRRLKLVELKGIEHDGDQLTGRIFEALNSTFLTPLDREDIRALAVDIDDVLDYIEGTAQFLVLFESAQAPSEVARFAEILFEMIRQIDAITGLIWDQRNGAKIHDRMMRISDLENQADAIYISALGTLFKSGSGRDAIEVLKWKEIYQGLEDACDKCKDFTHVVGNIVIKNA